MKKILTAGILALTLGIAGVAQAETEGDATAGATTFKKYCKMCHNKDGSKSTMAKDIRGSSKETVLKALRGEATNVSGKYKMMVSTIKKRKLTEEDAANIAAFLKK